MKIDCRVCDKISASWETASLDLAVLVSRERSGACATPPQGGVGQVPFFQPPGGGTMSVPGLTLLFFRMAGEKSNDTAIPISLFHQPGAARGIYRVDDQSVKIS